MDTDAMPQARPIPEHDSSTDEATQMRRYADPWSEVAAQAEREQAQWAKAVAERERAKFQAD
jgi:hypothetical protein